MSDRDVPETAVTAAALAGAEDEPLKPRPERFYFPYPIPQKTAERLRADLEEVAESARKIDQALLDMRAAVALMEHDRRLVTERAERLLAELEALEEAGLAEPPEPPESVKQEPDVAP